VHVTPVIGMDIPATILELANIDNKYMDGISLLPLIEDSNYDSKRPLFWHYPHYSNQGGIPAAAVRLGDYKLIQRLENSKMHLYNLSKDPGEKNDIANKYPKRVEQLTALLFAWYIEVDAQFLTPKDNINPWQLKEDFQDVL